jgi:hypothetical protein
LQCWRVLPLPLQSVAYFEEQRRVALDMGYKEPWESGPSHLVRVRERGVWVKSVLSGNAKLASGNAVQDHQL